MDVSRCVEVMDAVPANTYDRVDELTWWHDGSQDQDKLRRIVKSCYINYSRCVSSIEEGVHHGSTDGYTDNEHIISKPYRSIMT